MATRALLGKDLREHGLAALGLLLGGFALVALAIAQNRAAAFSMSPFEVVRFALITFVPLIVLTVGNRLVVREYLSGTRQFVEALPVGTSLPLTIKYLLGAGFLILLGVLLIALCTLGSSAADDVTAPWLALLLAKTVVILLLYWSIVFCFSLCGHLRIMLYLSVLGIAALIAWSPGIDSSRFAPFNLMDRDLFVFERDVVPVADMLWTLVIAAAFTAGGFLIARLGNGAVVERLAKPMSRRDFVVLGVLAAAGLTLGGLIAEDQSRDPIRFGTNTVLRNIDPAIEMYYAAEAYRGRSEAFMLLVKEAEAPLQTVLGIESLPVVRLALRPGREPHDIDYGTLDGVYVAANWMEHDSYDDAVLVAVVLHGLLSARTGGRAPFEPHHWVLDGFTRWWAETLGDPARLRNSHRDELLARAAFVAARLDEDADLVSTWQLVADRFGYPSAEALAFSAMHYLSESAGSNAVLAVGRAFLSEPVGASILASAADRRRPSWQRFTDATGISRDDFLRGWAQSLANATREPGVASKLAAVPPIEAVIDVADDAVPTIIAGYRATHGSTSLSDAYADTRCILRHGPLSAFDYEFDVDDEDELEAPCALDEQAHTLRGRYASGDRVYVALEMESPAFHQPLRLDSRRLNIP